jgi:hypothetical protein
MEIKKYFLITPRAKKAGILGIVFYIYNFLIMETPITKHDPTLRDEQAKPDLPTKRPRLPTG